MEDGDYRREERLLDEPRRSPSWRQRPPAPERARLPRGSTRSPRPTPISPQPIRRTRASADIPLAEALRCSKPIETETRRRARAEGAARRRPAARADRRSSPARCPSAGAKAGSRGSPRSSPRSRSPTRAAASIWGRLKAAVDPFTPEAVPRDAGGDAARRRTFWREGPHADRHRRRGRRRLRPASPCTTFPPRRRWRR